MNSNETFNKCCPDEIWACPASINSEFQISSCGRIRNRSGALLGGNDSNGYRAIRYRIAKGRRRVAMVHRLVAECFIPNPLRKPHINHIDFNRVNNHASNLEWVTIQENNRHLWASGRGAKPPLHYNNPRFKMTFEKAQELRRLLKPRVFTYRHAAEKFGISIANVSAIASYRNFNPLTHPNARLSSNE